MSQPETEKTEGMTYVDLQFQLKNAQQRIVELEAKNLSLFLDFQDAENKMIEYRERSAALEIKIDKLRRDAPTDRLNMYDFEAAQQQWVDAAAQRDYWKSRQKAEYERAEEYRTKFVRASADLQEMRDKALLRVEDAR